MTIAPNSYSRIVECRPYNRPPSSFWWASIPLYNWPYSFPLGAIRDIWIVQSCFFGVASRGGRFSASIWGFDIWSTEMFGISTIFWWMRLFIVKFSACCFSRDRWRIRWSSPACFIPLSWARSCRSLPVCSPIRSRSTSLSGSRSSWRKGPGRVAGMGRRGARPHIARTISGISSGR